MRKLTDTLNHVLAIIPDSEPIKANFIEEFNKIKDRLKYLPEEMESTQWEVAYHVICNWLGYVDFPEDPAWRRHAKQSFVGKGAINES